MIPQVEILIGTYEEFLLGYKIEKKNEKYVCTQTFADKSHSGPIKCIGVQGFWVATGSSDDRIFIYNMRTRKQVHLILSHEGTINALAFVPDETYLLSGSADGSVLVTRTKTWQLDGNWNKAHGGSAVTHIACHPSGKLALTLGTDLILRSWDLVKGRVAYKKNFKNHKTIGRNLDCIEWSPSGDNFTISGNRTVEIWSIKSANIVHSHENKAKPNCLVWISDDSLVIGLENGEINWIFPNDDKEIIIAGHNARVKALHFYKNLLVTASSTGEIKVWQVDESNLKLKELCKLNTGCRPTCIKMIDLEQLDNLLEQNSVGTKTGNKQKINKLQEQKPKGFVSVEYENDDADNEAENN